MRIDEVVLDFPKKYRKSDVIGKSEDGKLVRKSEIDSLTGLPLDRTKQFLLVDLETGQAVAQRNSQEAAETEKARLEKWEKISVGIQEL